MWPVAAFLQAGTGLRKGFEGIYGQSWLCRPLKGTWFPLRSFPDTAVPRSGFFRPFRDWFAEKLCGRTVLELCWKPEEISEHDMHYNSLSLLAALESR
jgi:hypothetical protein